MKSLFVALLLLVAGVAQGLSEDEFALLYASAAKDAEACYKLYRAYAQGEGVARDESQARKWLLAAHNCGMLSTRAEIARQPWRKALGLRESVPEVDDATAAQKGEELLDLLLEWNGSNFGVGMALHERKLPPRLMRRVQELIEAGADLNLVRLRPQGASHSALSLACFNGDLELARLLIDHGADPCAHSMLALEYSLVPYVRQALEVPPLYADAEEGERRLRKPTGRLHAQTPQQQRSCKVVRFLIENGLDTALWTDYGWSLACLVVSHQGLLALEALCDAGMDINAPQRPEECVAGAMPRECMETLYADGCVEQRVPPICYAVRNMMDVAVEQLVRLRADTATPVMGKSVMQLARDTLQSLPDNREMSARGLLLMQALEKAFRRDREEKE